MATAKTAEVKMETGGGPDAAVASSGDQFIHPDLRDTNISMAPTAPMMATAGSPSPQAHNHNHQHQQAIAPPPQPISSPPTAGPMTASAAGTPVPLLAPAISSPSQSGIHHLVQPIPAQDTLADGRKKRELSQSKRAAQNRAAQRAFRQRKDAYIKKLESQVSDMPRFTDHIKDLEIQNYGLREYISVLQNRLIERGGEIPAPEHNISLEHVPVMSQPAPVLEDARMGDAPMGEVGPIGDAPMSDAHMSDAPMNGSPGSDHHIDAVAQAVVGLGAQEQQQQQQQQHPHQHESDEVGVNDGASYPQQFESEGP